MNEAVKAYSMGIWGVVLVSKNFATGTPAPQPDYRRVAILPFSLLLLLLADRILRSEWPRQSQGGVSLALHVFVVVSHVAFMHVLNVLKLCLCSKYACSVIDSRAAWLMLPQVLGASLSCSILEICGFKVGIVSLVVLI